MPLWFAPLSTTGLAARLQLGRRMSWSAGLRVRHVARPASGGIMRKHRASSYDAIWAPAVELRCS